MNQKAETGCRATPPATRACAIFVLQTPRTGRRYRRADMRRPSHDIPVCQSCRPPRLAIQRASKRAPPVHWPAKAAALTNAFAPQYMPNWPSGHPSCLTFVYIAGEEAAKLSIRAPPRPTLPSTLYAPTNARLSAPCAVQTVQLGQSWCNQGTKPHQKWDRVKPLRHFPTALLTIKCCNRLKP